MTALAGKRADIYVTGAALSYPANDPMSDISANVPANPATLARTVYAVTNAARRYFDPATPIVFQRSLDSGATWPAVTPDNVDAGLISFLAQQQAAPAAQFRVSSGKYLPYSRLGGGTDWSTAGAFELLDVTEFGHLSKRHLVSRGGGQVTLKRWWYDDTMRAALGSLMVLVLYVDATAQPAAPRYECLALMKADSIKAAAGAVLTEELSFEVQGDISFLSA